MTAPTLRERVAHRLAPHLAGQLEDATRAADLTADEAVPVVEGVTRRLTDSVRSDLFEAYVRALQATHGVRLNSAAIAAANARIQ